MSVHVFQSEQLVQRPRHEVFAFFADACNLEKLTPTSLQFHILTPRPIPVCEGALIDYRLRLFGVPFVWRTLIEIFEPETRFVDVQLRGPYRSWRHTHEFSDAAGGTLVADHVAYEMPLGPLGEAARALFVERTLRQIFGFRREAVGRIFS